MRTDSPSFLRRLPPLSTRWRLALLVLVSLIIHLVTIGVIPGWTIFSSQPDPEPLTAHLVPLPPPVEKEAPAIVPKHIEEPQKPSNRQTVARAAPPPQRSESPAPAALPDALPSATTVAPGTTVSPAPAEEDSPDAAGAGSVPPVTFHSLSADPAQSAVLDYRVTATDPRTEPPKTLVGSGQVSYRNDGTNYSVTLAARVSLLFLHLDLLSSTSQGHLDQWGLAPDSYSESQRNKSPAATRFVRDTIDPAQRNVSFDSGANVPLNDGVQDKLSVLLELGAILRAHPDLGRAGNNFDMQVAGVRGDLSVWHFSVVGDETTATGSGTLGTIHLRRAVRPDSHDRAVDVWLVAGHSPYPARILYTEPNSSTIDFVLDKIE